MKLYSTITSERASKSQGGNKFIEIRLSVGEIEESKRILFVRINVKDEGYHLTIEKENKKLLDEILH